MANFGNTVGQDRLAFYGFAVLAGLLGCADLASAQTAATVTLQGSATNFAVGEPGVTDTVADAFSFPPVTGAAKAAPAVSNTVTISGLGDAVPVAISGTGTPEFRINGGSLVTSGMIANGDSLTLSLVPIAWGTAYAAQVTVGDGTPVNFSVTSASAPTVGLAASVLPDADTGQSYNSGSGFDFKTLVSLAGGSPADPPVNGDLSWSSGTLPTGLSLSTAGVLSGTPMTAGEFTFTITSTLEAGITDSQSYTLYVFDNPLIIEGGN